jgi:hypothetical protein
MGDFNGSLLNYRQEAQSKALREFVSEHGLSTSPGIADMPTFYNYNGSTSQIDYILTTDMSRLQKVCIHERSPVNTSTHTLVSASIQGLLFSGNIETTHTKKSKRNRPMWSKCNSDEFENYVSAHLDIPEPPKSPEELESAITHITSVLQEATLATVPHKQSGAFKQKHFTELELEAIRDGKLAHRTWKDAGRPSAPHPAAVQWCTAQKKFRQIQRQVEAGKRNHGTPWG